jgi:hypothetical protein
MDYNRIQIDSIGIGLNDITKLDLTLDNIGGTLGIAKGGSGQTTANDALNVNKSVEISGFGKFFFNHKKAITQYKKLLNIKRTYENALADENITDTKRNALELKMQIVESSIKTLKPKIDEPGTNL